MAKKVELPEWFNEAERQERLAREAAWLECLARPDFYGLAHLMQTLVLDGEPSITDRKVQLFVVACARRVEHLLPNNLCRLTIELADQAADTPEALSSPPLPTY